MPPRLKMTLISFHISAVLYVLLGVGYGFFFARFPQAMELSPSFGLMMGVSVGVVCVLLAAGIEVVVAGLKQRKYWAWITGLVLCALFIPSCWFTVPGGLALWGLLDPETRAAFVPSPGGPSAAPPPPGRESHGPSNPWEKR